MKGIPLGEYERTGTDVEKYFKRVIELPEPRMNIKVSEGENRRELKNGKK